MTLESTTSRERWCGATAARIWRRRPDLRQARRRAVLGAGPPRRSRRPRPAWGASSGRYGIRTPPGATGLEDGVWAPPGGYTVVLDGRRDAPHPAADGGPPSAGDAAAGGLRPAVRAGHRIEGARGRLAAVARENGALLTALAERGRGSSGVAKAIDALQKRAEETSGGSAAVDAAEVTHHPARHGRWSEQARHGGGRRRRRAVAGCGGGLREDPAKSRSTPPWRPQASKTKDLAALDAQLEEGGRSGDRAGGVDG